MTEKVRVYELAKEMLVDSKVIIKVLHEMGVPAKNHMSTMDPATRDKVVEILTTKAKSGEAKQEIAEKRDKKGTSGAASPPRAAQPRIPQIPQGSRVTYSPAPNVGRSTRPTPTVTSGVPRFPGERRPSETRTTPAPPTEVRLQTRAQGTYAPSTSKGNVPTPAPQSKTISPLLPAPSKSPIETPKDRAAVTPGLKTGGVQDHARTGVAVSHTPGPFQPKSETKSVVKPEHRKDQAVPSKEHAGEARVTPTGRSTGVGSAGGAQTGKAPSAEGGLVRDVARQVPQQHTAERQEIRLPAAPHDRGPGPGVAIGKPPARDSVKTAPTASSLPVRRKDDERSREGSQRREARAVRIPPPPTEASRREPVAVQEAKRDYRGKADKPRYEKWAEERFSYDREDERLIKKIKPAYSVGVQPKKAQKLQEKAKVISIEERRPRKITFERPITVSELARMMDMKASDLIKRLVALGIMAGINQQLDVETASLIAQELGYEVEQKTPEDRIAALLQEETMDPERLVSRPPVVTVMGHVDHGKTSLLDAIRHTRVAAGEAGGITQHIGAYKAEWQGREITFIDTPGHEAFTAMRARGAKVTDIAVLVVAADDGVMPQTVEAINHAKAAGVPIVVAINKIDKPGANPERVKQSLSELGLIPDDWGGDTVCVPVSAKQGTGIDKLLEMILLVADIQELKADPTVRARGVVIEAKIDRGRGPVATVLVQNGTLKDGDTFVAGSTWGKVRTMTDHRSKRLKRAGPSTPVEVTGFNEIPQAGDSFIVVDDEKTAKEVASLRQLKRRDEYMQRSRPATLEDLIKEVKEGEVKELNLVVKGDVQGTVEAVKQTLGSLATEEVRAKVIHSGVGPINESDIMLAKASGAIVIGFNVKPDANAKQAAEAEQVDVRTYSIIYEAVEDIKNSLRGMEQPKYREVLLGRAEVRAVFKSSKAGLIAGSYVLEGKVEKNAVAKVLRNGDVIFEGKITSLRRFKDDVREVAAGYECGIGLAKVQDIKEGDIIETYGTEEIKPGG
ncbi:MAG TPA: translation initiation factor IF-2 [Clostridia bacterium]|nr:translation initiation factor IF-2 [Clostridia bacterium]